MAAKNQEPKRHHYLPEFYLSAWCRPNGPLIRYTNERGRIHTREFYPGGVGYRTDLYKLKSTFIPEQQQLETLHYARLDNAASIVVAKMIRDVRYRLSRSEKVAVAKFVLSLPARNPWGIAMGRDLARQTFSARRAVPIDGVQQTGSLLESLEAQNPHFLSDATQLQMIESSQDPERIERVVGMEWHVWDLSGGTFDLVVSDQALYREGPLIGPEGCTLSLPLSPTTLMILNDGQLKTQTASQWVKVLNRRAAEDAVEHIFARDKRHVPLALRYLRQRTHPRT